MPQSKASSTPPPAMTWPKAIPVIGLAGAFDALRIFFELFWFFGPAVAGFYCTSVLSGGLSTWTFGLLGTKTAAAICAAGAVAGGAVLAQPLIALGVVMAMAVGFIGFLVLGFVVITKNPRLVSANASGAVWLIGSFALSELPLVGAIPSYSMALAKLYHTQIKKEQAALKAWQKAHAGELLRARQEQAAELMQMQTAQLQEQEAANDALYDEQIQEQEAADIEEARAAEAANDAQYTQEMDKAA